MSILFFSVTVIPFYMRLIFLSHVCECVSNKKFMVRFFTDKQNAEGTKDNTHMGEIKFIAHTSRKI